MHTAWQMFLVHVRQDTFVSLEQPVKRLPMELPEIFVLLAVIALLEPPCQNFARLVLSLTVLETRRLGTVHNVSQVSTVMAGVWTSHLDHAMLGITALVGKTKAIL